MCRLVAYLGTEILLTDVLVKPANSIVMQSLHAKESNIHTNGDGFGLGWYVPKISPDPALFLSVFPAWNDKNLLHLTAKIKSPCFFAHVRAATVGGINNYNCHPFIHAQWMLMHNGQIQDFVAVKRHLRRILDDDVYNWIQGETDSEHLFALFLQLSKGKDLSSLSVVAEVLQITLYEILQLVNKFGKKGPSFFNIVLTDGKRLIASRYCTGETSTSESLYYFSGKFFPSKDDYQEKQSNKNKCVMITSEKLTDFNTNDNRQWRPVPDNHLLLVDSDSHIQCYPIIVI